MLEGTPSQGPLKMNLQLFAEGDPTPNDPPVDPTPTDPTPTDPIPTDPSSADPPSDPTPPQDPEPQKIKIKFNHEEKEIPYEEAVTHIQKGMNYDKAIERAKQEATDTWIANQGYEWNGKPITTEAEYQQALSEQAEQQRRASLEEKGIDPSIVDEYVSSNPVVRKAAELIKQQEQQQKQTAQYGEFLDYFKQENDRDFNPATDKIPPEVWEQTAKGKSLADAYAHHENKQLRARLKAFETNTKNAGSSPGSVTGSGAIKDLTLTPEAIEAMSDQQRIARWPEIKKVLGMK